MFLLLALTGCTKIVQHSYLKNYTLGEIQTAYIGQPVIKIRDFYQDINSDNNNKCFYAKPSSDFTISGVYTKKLFDRNLNIKGSSQRYYSLNDSIKLDGLVYSIFDISDNNGNKYGLMVDSKGKVLVKSVYEDNHDRSSMYDLHNAVLSPENTTMIVSGKVSPCYGADDDIVVGNNNFELLYGGINNVTISMTYREFTRNDLARPSFFQNLIYETGAKEIRFKDFKIAVIDSTNEKIVYKLIEDKLEDVVFRRDGQEIEALEKAEMNNRK